MRKIRVIDIIQPRPKRRNPIEDRRRIQSELSTGYVSKDINENSLSRTGRITFWIVLAFSLLALCAVALWFFATHLNFSMMGIGNGKSSKKQISLENLPAASLSAGLISKQDLPADTRTGDTHGDTYIEAHYANPKVEISKISVATVTPYAQSVAVPYPFYFAQGAKNGGNVKDETSVATTSIIASDNDFTVLSPDPPITDCPDAD